MKLLITAIICSTLICCGGTRSQKQLEPKSSLKLGSERLDELLPLLHNKKVGIVANQSTFIKNTHLVDSLLSLNINITKIFCPEHGFRGEGEAGEHIESHIDSQTGLPVISLYGSHKKPTHQDFSELDIVIFDMQDVGVRFYTYISTMHYVMETCAEMNLPLVILDRPNPNGFYVDGPVLDTNYRSFVGMHPVPLVHGMTIGEFAKMINGEGWLNNSMICDITIIPCLNYTHDSIYNLPIRPSPNLPNQTSIYLYPSLGFFEGTVVSIGRGTDFPFQVFGHPSFKAMEFNFIPESRPGASKNPPLLGETCLGVDLRDYSTDYFLELSQVNLGWLLFAYQSFPQKDKFFNSYFTVLAGSKILREQIELGVDEQTIRDSWKSELEKFLVIRSKYLIYPDFSKQN
ncbi:MAG: DUF1343 domain-containing protein [Bacteroidetes bacterium HGW-Bacteroidetes-15]|nr:MAG: DUF1343 domain-containing protein [Bacteroidetes bacterium HGW-Bacteroidetes-15]